MEENTAKEKKLKLKKKLLVIRDILIVMLAFFFIIVGFMYGIDNGNAAGDTLQNIRYGMLSFALIISSTLLIIAVYNRKKK